MSSPIHRGKDRDKALLYAPPWARQPGPGIAGAPPPVKYPVPSRRGSGGQGSSGDLAMAQLQRQLAHDPRKVPRPPRAGAGDHFVGKIALRMGGVAAAAALVAWGMMSITGARLLRNESAEAGFTSPPSTTDRSVRDPGGTAGKRPVKTGQAAMREPSPARVARKEDNGAVPPMAAPSPPAPRFTPAPQSTPAAPQPPSATSSVQARSDSDSVKLDAQDIAMLVSRGEDYLTNGDLASARLLLRRAAAAGSANAALALGATFDPLVIRRLGAIGTDPDIARARKWYQKAAELGSTAASRQLATLAQLPQ